MSYRRSVRVDGWVKRSDYERYPQGGDDGADRPEQRPAGPSGDDFWGGEPVGVAEPSTDL